MLAGYQNYPRIFHGLWYSWDAVIQVLAGHQDYPGIFWGPCYSQDARTQVLARHQGFSKLPGMLGHKHLISLQVYFGIS